jgi:Zn/Cd-binding protein ZinT
VLDYTIDPAIKELHLISNISSLHMTTVQYSILKYELNSKEIKHAFQVFQVDRKSGIYTLIEDHSLNIPKAKWQESFPYLTGMNVEGDF